MEEKVFDRVEKKYLLTKDDKKELLRLIKKNMKKDIYYKTQVINLYFDNDNYDLITNSIDWVDFKEKVRARTYEGYDRVFLEVKTKIHTRARTDKDETSEENIGYKRRVMITHEDFEKLIKKELALETLAAQSIETKHDLQIAREIDYLIDYLKLEPKIFITYERQSYKDNHNLRITFDEKLKYRTNNLSLNKEKRDKIYFKGDHDIIMEVKADGVMPLWLVKKLSELKLYPQQFSKIGKVYERIRNV